MQQTSKRDRTACKAYEEQLALTLSTWNSFLNMNSLSTGSVKDVPSAYMKVDRQRLAMQSSHSTPNPTPE